MTTATQNKEDVNKGAINELPFEADSNGTDEVTDEAAEVVVLKIKRSQPKRMVTAIANANVAIEVEETPEFYTLKAPYIKVRRSDVEAITGALSDTKWRMLFMNRTGEVREFSNYEFIMGVPQPVQTEAERREWTQMNVRLPKDLKEEMEELRKPEILNMSQNEFVAEALAEYIAMLRREMA